MYKLNFPNGNVQTYSSLNDLAAAAKAFGGDYKSINSIDKTYAFVPKK